MVRQKQRKDGDPMRFLTKYRAVISLILCTSLLTGCWDREEINDVAFVIGIAADKEGDEYRSSLQIALPGQSGASGSEGGGAVQMVTSHGLSSPTRIELYAGLRLRVRSHSLAVFIMHIAVPSLLGKNWHVTVLPRC